MTTKLWSAIKAVKSSLRLLRSAGVASRNRRGDWTTTALGRKAMAQVYIEEQYARLSRKPTVRRKSVR